MKLREDKPGQAHSAPMPIWSGLTRVRTNGLCAARDGTLYVTSIGSGLQTQADRTSGNIIRVAPDGAAAVICDHDLMFPNGVALTPDEKFLADRSRLYATGADGYDPRQRLWERRHRLDSARAVEPRT